MKQYLSLMLAGALMVSGCGTVSLTEAGSGVRLMKNDPPMECKQLEDIQVEADDLAGAKNELRNQAAEKNADYVRLDHVGMDGGDAIATGSLFQCRPQSNQS